MPLTPFAGNLDQKRAAHLVRRATFGATKTDIDSLVGSSPAQAVMQLFNNNLPDPVLPIDPEIGQEWVLSGVDGNDNARQGLFRNWLFGQLLNPATVPAAQKLSYANREKITFFLHTYFTTKISKVNDSRALYFQNALFRFFAFDSFLDPTLNFKSLTKKICVDNAMLIFLDGTDNIRGNVNENYARELLELFSIGRGLEGTNPPVTEVGDYYFFTEQDVQEAAKVLSGWAADDEFAVIDEDTGLPRGAVKGNALDASQHAEGDKQFSGRFGNQIVSPDPLLFNGGNQTEESALDEIDQLIEMIYSQEETARHLCRKLYRFYVYYEITQDIEDNVITEMANTFIANDYSLQPVLEELFTSQVFYDAAGGLEDDKFGGIIKSPLDLVTGTINYLNLPVPDYESDTQGFNEFAEQMLGYAESMGMDVYEPFEVAGYGAYHQFPRYNRNWISTHWLTQRYSFIREVFMSMDDMLLIDPLVFVQTYFNGVGSDARQLIIELAPYFFPMADNLTYDSNADPLVERGLTPARMRYFLQAFLGFTEYETEADMAVAGWVDLYTQPANYLEASTRLTSLFNAMMQSPEYQLF